MKQPAQALGKFYTGKIKVSMLLLGLFICYCYKMSLTPLSAGNMP